LRSDLPRRLLLVACIAGSLAVAGLPAVVHAKVFLARDEALQLAFPDVERVEARDIVLTAEQHDRVQKAAHAPLESSLVTFYVGWTAGAPVGYAMFDTHNVRTYPETFLVVLSADGAVQGAHMLAFHEPEEYMPNARWLDTFKGAHLSNDLEIGHGVAAITGSTLSTRAVTSGIRRVLAIWDVTIGGK